jgi:hypothetical protein
LPPGRRSDRDRNTGSEGTFWSVWSVEVVGRRREEWVITRCDGRRFGKRRELAMWFGRVERGVSCGRDKLRDFVSGAMALRMMLTRLAIVKVLSKLTEFRVVNRRYNI